ncbi:MAG: hypothetical protein V1860_01760 [bacterium]
MPIKSRKLNFLFDEKNHKIEKNGLCRIILSKDFFNQELKLPEIFAIVEIKNENIAINANDLLNTFEIKITEKIKKIYNSVNERKSLQTENLSEHILELLLKSLNSEIKYILEEEKFHKFLIGDLNIFIGVIEPFIGKNEEKYYFHFSCLNRINNLLVYRQGDKYKLMDVLEANNEAGSGKEGKIFANIISGELDNDSYLIIANQNLLNYIISDKLKQVVISMDADSAVRHLKKMLNEVDISHGIEFAAILIYLITAAEEKMPLENSIEKLIITGKNTEKFLTPSIIPDFKNSYAKIKSLSEKLSKSFYGKIVKLKSGFKKKKKQEYETAKKHSNFGLKKIKPYIFKISSISIKYVKIFFLLIKKILLEILTLIVLSFRKIKKISLKPAMLIMALIIILFLFWKGTSMLNNTKVKKANEKAYNEALIELEQKFSSLEADIIYNNYADASKILEEIDNLMKNQMAVEAPEYKEKYDDTKKKVDDFEKKINKVVEILTPEKTDIGNNGSELNDITLKNNSFLGFNYACEKIYIKDGSKPFDLWDLSENIINLADFKYLSNLKTENEIILYSDKNNKIYKFNIKDKKITALNNILPEGEIKNIYSYASSIYIINGQDNQIYAYKSAAGKKWINNNSGIDFAGAIDMAIDGNIYILKNGGTILKFYKGDLVNFKLPDIKPALLTPVKIYVNSDSEFLYILDPMNKRIVVFNKETCALVSQYTSENFSNLKDFAVDEKNKIIYVLNGNEIYKINFQQ